MGETTNEDPTIVNIGDVGFTTSQKCRRSENNTTITRAIFRRSQNGNSIVTWKFRKTVVKGVSFHVKPSLWSLLLLNLSMRCNHYCRLRHFVPYEAVSWSWSNKQPKIDCVKPRSQQTPNSKSRTSENVNSSDSVRKFCSTILESSADVKFDALLIVIRSFHAIFLSMCSHIYWKREESFPLSIDSYCH